MPGDALAHPSGGRATRVVGGAVVLTILILAGLFAADLATGRRMAAATRGEPDVTISLTGHQWWWEARYESAVAADQVVTANELHIPVGARVLIKLNSGDVIHSFWVPGLNGKQDLIPGYTNSIWLQADTAGTYPGRCAEYCGHQHALMQIRVIAVAPAEYQRWLRAQAAPAILPATPQEQRGRDVFMASTCPLCHTVGGTEAGGRTGPDLTHVGSRQTLAAGTLENTPASLAAWVTVPQRIKPGARMPGTPLPAADRAALVAYLGSLQ
jgi:cytochrome c oxidase subunit 2